MAVAVAAVAGAAAVVCCAVFSHRGPWWIPNSERGNEKERRERRGKGREEEERREGEEEGERNPLVQATVAVDDHVAVMS